jgi:hypothetical protein
VHCIDSEQRLRLPHGDRPRQLWATSGPDERGRIPVWLSVRRDLGMRARSAQWALIHGVWMYSTVWPLGQVPLPEGRARGYATSWDLRELRVPVLSPAATRGWHRAGPSYRRSPKLPALTPSPSSTAVLGPDSGCGQRIRVVRGQ